MRDQKRFAKIFIYRADRRAALVACLRTAGFGLLQRVSRGRFFAVDARGCGRRDFGLKRLRTAKPQRRGERGGRRTTINIAGLTEDCTALDEPFLRLMRA